MSFRETQCEYFFPSEAGAESHFVEEATFENEYGVYNSKGLMASERSNFDLPRRFFMEEGTTYDVLNALSCDSNFLVRNNGDCVPVKSLAKKVVLVCCFMVPVWWSGPESSILRAISLMSQELRDIGNFELVVVAQMRAMWANNLSFFNQFFSGLPSFCLAVPFSDSVSRDRICHSLNLTSPRPVGLLVKASLNKVFRHDYLDFFVDYGADAFPFTRQVLEGVANDESTYRWWANWALVHFTQSPSLTFTITSLYKNPGGGSEEVTVLELEPKLVGLYLCCSGNLLTTLHGVHQECTYQGREFEIVLIFSPFNDGWDPLSFQQVILRTLKEQQISWWVLPFQNWVSRRLWRLCHKGSDDKLIIKGPNSNFVEPHAESMISSFGSSAYPFSRELLINKEIDRLKAITLESLLVYKDRDYVVRPEPNYSYHSNKNVIRHVPVAEFQGRNIFVYLDFLGGHSDIFFTLKKKYEQIKAIEIGFEVVFVSLGKKLNDLYYRGMEPVPWLVCPSDPEHSQRVAKQIFADDKDICGTVVAFGKDGRICSVRAQYLLDSHGTNFYFQGNLRSEIIAGFRKQHLPDCCL